MHRAQSEDARRDLVLWTDSRTPVESESGDPILARTLGRLIVVATLLLLSVDVAEAGKKRFPNARRDNQYEKGIGWYVGLGAGYALDMAAEDALNARLRALGYSAGAKVKGSPVIHARFGQRAHPHFAIEAQFEYAFGFDTQATVNNLSIDASSHWTLTGTANLKVPVLTESFQPFGIFGAGFMAAKVEDRFGGGLQSSDLDLAIRGGGGFEYWITNDFGLSAEATYVLPFGRLEDLDYLSIGLSALYRF